MVAPKADSGATTEKFKEVGARMRIARQHLSMNQSQFYDKYVAQRATLRSLQRAESGSNESGMTLIECFANAGINTNWLLTGEGNMLVSNGYAANQERAPYSVESGYISVPLYEEVRVSAGPSATVECDLTTKPIRFNETWLRTELGVNPAALILVLVDGDSMDPTFRSGDLVLVDTSANRLVREGVYVLRDGDMLLIKRVRAIFGGGIEIISDNQAFRSVSMTANELESANFQVIGRVVWGGRRF